MTEYEAEADIRASRDNHLLEEALERLTEEQYIDWLRARHFHTAAELWEKEFERKRREKEDDH